MKALLKIEWIKTWRSWPVFIMGIGIPVGFFLLFSSIFSAPTPEAQKEFLLSYMLTMTGFSMWLTCSRQTWTMEFFSRPSMVQRLS